MEHVCLFNTLKSRRSLRAVSTAFSTSSQVAQFSNASRKNPDVGSRKKTRHPVVLAVIAAAVVAAVVDMPLCWSLLHTVSFILSFICLWK